MDAKSTGPAKQAADTTAMTMLLIFAIGAYYTKKCFREVQPAANCQKPMLAIQSTIRCCQPRALTVSPRPCETFA